MDAERGSIDIEIPKLGQLYIEALRMYEKSKAAMALKNCDEIAVKGADYGDIVYEVMKNRSPETGVLTVYEVNKYLDLIVEHFKQKERNHE